MSLIKDDDEVFSGIHNFLTEVIKNVLVEKVVVVHEDNIRLLSNDFIEVK